MKHMMRDVQTIFQPMTKECLDDPVFLVVVGSVGWDILYAEGHTRDCWKPVVLDRLLKPSSGITLRDLCSHSNLQRITVGVHSLPL